MLCILVVLRVTALHANLYVQDLTIELYTHNKGVFTRYNHNTEQVNGIIEVTTNMRCAESTYIHHNGHIYFCSTVHTRSTFFLSFVCSSANCDSIGTTSHLGYMLQYRYILIV